MIFRKKKAAENLRELIRDHVKSTYPLIDVIGKRGVYNNTCFFNAVQWVYDHPRHKDSATHWEVVEVIYIHNGYPILHYINKLGDEYFDTTVGFVSGHYDYYLIRTINPRQYFGIEEEFTTARAHWTHLYMDWWDINVHKFGWQV